MKYYMGIDLSLAGTGIVILDEDSRIVEAECLKFKSKGMERLYAIRKEFWDYFFDYTFETVAIENYSMGSRAGQAFSIGELGGVIKLMLWEKDINPILVAPSQLKKYATGKGNAAKDQIMMHVYKKWGFESPDNNVGDAYVLAQIALTMSRGVINPADYTKPQLEVIDKLTEE